MGSGGGSGQVDTAYNARMAAIAEEQQAQAQELFQYWKTGPGKWVESATPATGGTTGGPTAPTSRGASLSNPISWVKPGGDSVNPARVTTAAGGSTTWASPTPAVTQKTWVSDPDAVSYMQMEQEQIRANLGLIPKQTAAAKMFYDEAMKGVNVDERVSQAQADVSQSFSSADAETRRWASRYGINPSSGAFASTMAGTQRAKAASLAGATSLARRSAEDESFRRLSATMGLGSA